MAARTPHTAHMLCFPQESRQINDFSCVIGHPQCDWTDNCLGLKRYSRVFTLCLPGIMDFWIPDVWFQMPRLPQVVSCNLVCRICDSGKPMVFLWTTAYVAPCLVWHQRECEPCPFSVSHMDVVFGWPSRSCLRLILLASPSISRFSASVYLSTLGVNWPGCPEDLR